MSKEYVLIKEYPGSPKLGTISSMIKDDSIECYPEFWERISKKSILVTYDKMDAFEGDSVYILNTNEWTYIYIDARMFIDTKEENCIVFFKKKSMMEYIKNNIPKFSINQIEEALTMNYGKATGDFVDDILILDENKFRQKLGI